MAINITWIVACIFRCKYRQQNSYNSTRTQSKGERKMCAPSTRVPLVLLCLCHCHSSIMHTRIEYSLFVNNISIWFMAFYASARPRLLARERKREKRTEERAFTRSLALALIVRSAFVWCCSWRRSSTWIIKWKKKYSHTQHGHVVHKYLRWLVRQERLEYSCLTLSANSIAAKLN